MTPGKITLIGDGIENPWNARTLMDAAQMFGGDCLFRDRRELMRKWQEDVPAKDSLKLIAVGALAHTYSPLVALENREGAASIYGFRLPKGASPALVVGNERRGIADDLLDLADHAVQIPMFARKLNSLNVAAASAVALYYLSRGGGPALQLRSNPSKRRPEVAMVGVQDHVELGSSIRSAGAFGWERILVEDRAGAWFGRRHVRAEARAAARSHRNPILVVPIRQESRYAFDEVCVLTTKLPGLPLHKANLARGSRQLIAIPDESAQDAGSEDWHRFSKSVQLIRLDFPGERYVYHYRLIASVVLSEVARQVGQKARPIVGRPKRQEPFYDSSLSVLLHQAGETVFIEDLEDY